MKTFKLIAFLIFSHGVKAETEGGVHSIVKGKAGEPHLVKFNSGVVKFIEQGEEKKLAIFKKLIKILSSRMRCSCKSLLSLYQLQYLMQR